jgi:hypothetical protein
VKEAKMDIRNAVEKKAYELYEDNGCVSGCDLEHWLEAERIIYAGFPSAANNKSAVAITTTPINADQDMNEPMKIAAKKVKTKITDTIKRVTKKVKAK